MATQSPSQTLLGHLPPAVVPSHLRGIVPPTRGSEAMTVGLECPPVVDRRRPLLRITRCRQRRRGWQGRGRKESRHIDAGWWLAAKNKNPTLSAARPP